jgi:hypothetical protein
LHFGYLQGLVDVLVDGGVQEVHIEVFFVDILALGFDDACYIFEPGGPLLSYIVPMSLVIVNADCTANRIVDTLFLFTEICAPLSLMLALFITDAIIYLLVQHGLFLLLEFDFGLRCV